jgi:hypothetical protein
LPGEIASGTGALRIWFKVARQELVELVADVELATSRQSFRRSSPKSSSRIFPAEWARENPVRSGKSSHEPWRSRRSTAKCSIPPISRWPGATARSLAWTPRGSNSNGCSSGPWSH